jgi:hypothetical protein
MPAQLDDSYIKFAGWKGLVKRYFAWYVEGRPLTTRFRFLNIFSGFMITLMMFFGRFLKKDISVIHVIGLGRSGTTYLGKILGLLNSAVFLNEPKLAWSFAWSEDDIIGSYSKRGFYREHLEQDSKRYELLLRFYRSVAFIMRSRIIVDKYPEVIFRVKFLSRFFLNKTTLVYAHRDWRDVVNSIPKWNLHHSNDTCNWWGLHDRKWQCISKELIACSKFDLIKYKESKDDMIRAFIEWILTVEEFLSLKDAGYDIKLFCFEYPNETLKAFLVDFGADIKSPSWLYFEESFNKVVYKNVKVPKDLIEIGNELNSRVISLINPTLLKNV